MMLLDADVLLELISGSSYERQAEWFKLHPERPHTTALAVAEILAAIGSMTALERMSSGNAVAKFLATVMDRRVVPFDLDCAEHLARLAQLSRSDGSNYPLAYLLTAAMALRFGAELVTARPEEYAGLGVPTVTP
ncbi:hypothetical protein IV500_07235 [Paeniglutamicibacter antarcticus]|uniref:PIN domain-containing protein n=1 Tax=Arthrobacter terrae TaxID=2935737 RepID=A0A931G7D8_9MICC|nr:PIN domain-containing protein [Arthrobacter terrae]MBG0739184.1 hypothetical protein [Arthrobacter terrae]